MRKIVGFTLIELMVALAILGLIVAISLPSYRQSIRKSNRSDAHISMSRLATLQEKFYFQNNNYTGDFADIISGASSGAPVLSDEGHYTITLSVTGGGSGWNMIAVPIDDQAGDEECVSLTLTSFGAKTALDIDGAANPDCW